jgi:hypothetical protein
MELFSKILAVLQTNAVEIIATVLFMNIEYFLGKTELVKSGSTLELILNAAKAAIAKLLEFIGKRKPQV